MKKLVTTALLFFPILSWSQRGIDGPRTISSSGTIVNEYTSLTSDVSSGATSLLVSNNGLNTNNRFGAGNNLAQGDLIMIYQAQGATMDATPEQWGSFSDPNTSLWGAILAYNNCGNYEFAEVESTNGTNEIVIRCGLQNSYTANGHTQVIRVPRYTTLTINSGGVLTGQAWNGSTGGIVVTEVDGATVINGGGSIDASNLGFRGGVNTDNNTVNGGGYFATNNDVEGAEKGESIAGYTTEYIAVLGRYCMGAPANGGGGGTSSNAGGGGGANGGVGTWTGNGNPDTNPIYTSAWDREVVGFGSTTSSGGGRGGYSHSASNRDATAEGPGNTNWGGDSRRNRGGLGGRPLDYSTGKIFFGGGGGAGEQNNSFGGNGGLGGGIVYILAYGNISGNGQILSNGQNGLNTIAPAPGASSYTGHDGAGGAGGGGAVILNTSGNVSGLTINANGGQGGNVNMSWGFLNNAQDAYGPGGGGGGGYIAISNGTATRNTNAGNNGTTNSRGMTEFPPNGATRGAAGTNNATIDDYSFTITNQTVCSGGSVTLTATINGTVPGGTTLTWYDAPFGNVVGTGNSFTTPVLATTTTYYVGFCPGSYTLPVTVTVGSNPTINTTNISIQDETCAGNDGSITGIVASGTGTLTYEWNSVITTDEDLTGVGAGNYTLVVTDPAGCSSSAGPFTINSGGGPVIDITNIVITPTTCGNNNGSITGITVSGGTGTITLDWNGTPINSADTLNLVAGSYTLTATDGIGCSSSSGPYTINASSNPVIDTTNITVTNPTCGNNNGSITGIVITGGSGSNTITWNSNPGSEDIFSLGAGNYTISVTDGSGCNATLGPITLNSLGAPTIDDSNILITDATCGNSNGSITGIIVSGGTPTLVYSWNGTNSVGADTTLIAGGSYSLQITDGSGCVVTSGPYTVNSTTNPVVTINGTDASCFGLTDGSAVASATGGDGNYSYQWISGPTTATYSGIGAGTYNVIVTDGDGCTSGNSITILEPNEIIGAVSGSTTICMGNSTTLTASGSSQFEWSTTETTAAITVSPTTTTNYTVVISDGTCNDTVDVTVTVNDLPIGMITGDSILCEGESLTLTASGGDTYLWNTTSTSTTINDSPTSNTSYQVTVTNSCGSDIVNVNVVINPLPIASAGTDVVINLGNSTTLTGTGGTSFTWTPSSGLSCTNCSSPTASPTVTTEYIVVVTDANGCMDSDTVLVEVEESFVLFIPDAFSPNNDNNNDILYVRGTGLENFVFKLYDRWGEKVFETTDVTLGWNGEYKNVALNEGVFVYVFEGNFIGQETFVQKGNITLHR